MPCPAGRIARRECTGLELADLFREHAHELGSLGPHESKVVRAILKCRTAALGGHRQTCDHCGYEGNFYNSCRDRHCPKCQTLRSVRWVEARKAELLPLSYFHLVFTIPEELHPLFLSNRKIAYGLLFAAVAETLLEVAENPDHLGARIGFTAVLHTWTQQLRFHPHIHCIVPGGGLDPEGARWISSRSKFFLPNRVLSKVFRGKLLSKLEGAPARGEIRPPRIDPKVLLIQAAQKEWVVYSKPPFAGPDQVVAYLGRYTHRIAISNDRLLSIQDGRVTFRFRDRVDGNQTKLMTLDAAEFLRRFLLHVLPNGFVRIRHYGFLANPVRRKNIQRCKQLLNVAESELSNSDQNEESETWQEMLFRLTGKDVSLCPQCGKAGLRVDEIPRLRAAAASSQIARDPSSPRLLPGRASSP